MANEKETVQATCDGEDIDNRVDEIIYNVIISSHHKGRQLERALLLLHKAKILNQTSKEILPSDNVINDYDDTILDCGGR